MRMNDVTTFVVKPFMRIVLQITSFLIFFFHLFSTCPVLVQYLFSVRLNKYWTSTEHVVKKCGRMKGEKSDSLCSTFETSCRVTVALSAMSCMDRCLCLRASIIFYCTRFRNLSKGQCFCLCVCIFSKTWWLLRKNRYLFIQYYTIMCNVKGGLLLQRQIRHSFLSDSPKKS